METLQNSKTIINYNPAGESAIDILNGKDLQDRFNEPAFFAKTARSHKKAWAALKSKWTETTSLGEACMILRDNGIKTHYYCAVD